MTDKELLELAAKAAGVVSLSWGVDSPERQISGVGQFIGATWNPLTDDGDALRLAVKLELFDLDKLLVELDISDRAASHELDPCAATRRAIVRAAAEIGKAG